MSSSQPDVLDRLHRQLFNLNQSYRRTSSWSPASVFTEKEKSDTRPCMHCGGLRREHGIYGTFDHVPDLDKPNEGHRIATAFCAVFEPKFL